MKEREKILIIDDEIGPREAFKMILKDNYSVATASSAEKGLKLLSDKIAIVILDIRMPRVDGFSALKQIKSYYPDTEVIMVTAYASVETARRAIQFGAIDYLIKPFDKDEVVELVRRGIEKRKQGLEHREEHVRLKELVDKRTKRLKITEKMLRELFGNANDGIIIMDSEGRIIDINRRACEIHGYVKEELKGKCVDMFETERNRSHWQARLKRILKGEAMVFETKHVKKDGAKAIIEVSEKAIDIDGDIIVQSFQRDITERKRLQEQLFHSQKMESVGTLASGVAHDFNNILTAILGYVAVIKNRIQQDDNIYRSVNTIEKAAQQGADLVKKLLTVSRKGSLELRLVDINIIIEDSVEILRRSIAKEIDIKLHLDRSLPKIKADSTHMQQVILNFACNARDAMPEGGELRIATTKISGKQNVSAGLPSDGDFLRIALSDTGEGIDKEMQNNIFDPFFTTKDVGKGTGLGLYIVHSIVKSHNGYIDLESKPHKGSTFHIYLPIFKDTPGEF